MCFTRQNGMDNVKSVIG